MKGLYAQFETDPEIEKTGVWIEYGENSAGQPIRFLIARSGGGNTEYLKQLETKAKPYRRQIQTETVERKTLEKIGLQVFCATCVKGWENVEDRDGNPLPFTQENVVKLLTDLKDLFGDLQEQSNKSALYRQMVLEADAGN
jgi:hypothetical protein